MNLHFTKHTFALWAAVLAIPACGSSDDVGDGSVDDADAEEALSGSFPVKNPPDAHFVDFVVECTVTGRADDDPIVFPNQPGASHNHTFSGANPPPTAFTKSDDLMAAKYKSSCKLTKDRAAYWMPTIYADGVPITPYAVRVYYRAGTTNVKAVRPMPHGLKMIAGNAMATSPQPAGIAGWQCRNSSGNTIAKQSTPPACPQGHFLEPSVVFPNCWDGVRLDSPNHRDHMAYASGNACPASHPVHVPQVTMSQRYPIDATYKKKVTVASKMSAAVSPYTLHADWMYGGWDDAMMAYLTKNCINASVACADVTDHRLPPAR